MENKNSIFATPFFKQLICGQTSCDFLIEKNRCLEFFRHLEGQEVESKYFRQIKLSLFLKEYRELNQYYPCMLIDENFSWIGCDENGEYRYFSSKPNGRVFVFDILDLIQINFKMNYKEMIDFFKSNLSIIIKNEFLRIESQKYLDNIDTMRSMKDNNFELDKVLKNKEDIYIELNNIGLENLFSKTLCYGQNAMFFASTKYIRSRLFCKYSISTINKVVNLFSTVGLITKVQEHEIPLEFRESNKRKVKNFTSYYSIPNLEENFEGCLKKIKVLNENNLSYYNLTKKQVLEVFGEETFADVYVQETYNGKHNSMNEKTCLLDIFFDIYKEKGYVSKEDFYQSAPSSYSKTFVFKEFDEILKSNGFRLVKPNNRMKKKFSLSSNSSIAVKDVRSDFRNRTVID